MTSLRSPRHHLIASTIAMGLLGLSATALAERDRQPEPPAPPQGGGGITLQLGQSSSNRFLPRVDSFLVPVGTPSTITWSYAAEVAASDHISPIPGIFIPTNDPNAPTFYQFFVPEQSVLVETLDAAFPRDVWLRIIARCFDRWEAICGITFQFVGATPTPVPPDGSDGSDFEPWDEGDRWESPPAPDNDAAGFYAPFPGHNWDGDPDDIPDANFAVGDIRIAARTIDGRSSPDGTLGSAFYYVYPFDPTAGSGNGEGTAEMGNIILDAEELWNDPFAPNLLEVVMMRAIGEAIGVPYKCPRWVFPGNDPLLKPKLMELQEGDFLNESGQLTRPFPPLRIIEPQEDDIRSALQLFGDPTDNNNSFTQSTNINFIATEFTENGIIFRAIHPNTGVPTTRITNRAMVTSDFGAGDPDIDFYEIIVPNLVSEANLTIGITPVGTEYYTVGFTIDGTGFRSCDKTADQLDAGDLVNALTLDDLRFAIATLDEVNSLLFDVIDPTNGPFFLPFEGGPEPQDLLVYRDNNSFGEPESITLRVQPGRYFLIVRGRDDFSGPQAVQRYDLTIELNPIVDPESSGFARVINGDLLDGFPGTGRLALTEAAENGGPFTGETARLAIISGGLAFTGHSAFDGITAVETAWDGPNPASTNRSSDATRSLAAAAGREIDGQGFIGMAAPAEVVSTSVALQGQSLFLPGFPISLQAIYYSLFGLANPDVYQSLGLSGPPTVYLNLYNAPYVDIAGAGLIALAYDAASTMLNVPIIYSAGEFGLIDNDPDCGTGAGELAPGGQRPGSRTLGAPATAMNGITVTAVGGRTLNPTPQFQFPYYVLPSATAAQGPVDTVIAGGIVNNSRPGIDISAPGWQAVADNQILGGDPCTWFGHTPSGLISLPTLSTGGSPNPDAFALAGGTNIAAAVVAGAVALLQDAGAKFVDDQFPEGGLSTSPLVLKAVLLNSAVRMPGWSNTGFNGAGISADPINRRNGGFWDPNQIGGQISDNSTGVYDIAVGAGLLNVEQAFLQYLGPGVTKDPIETDPRIPTVTAPGPFTGQPVPPANAGSSGVPEASDEGEQDVMPDGFGGGGISLPGRNPGSLLPGILGRLPGGGLGPGPGGPGGPPIDFALRFFLSPEGLAPNANGDTFDPFDPLFNNPNDFDAVQIENAPVIPRFATLAEYDPNNPNAVQRLYIWAGMEGNTLFQQWDNISINIATTGDARIANYQIFNLDYQVNPNLEFRRWGIVQNGNPVPALPQTQRINNIFLNAPANSTTTGVFRGPGVDLDRHYSAEAEATLLGYIDVIGQGEIFLEVGPGGINLRDELPVDSRVFFGPGGAGPFGDDSNPVIFGNNVGVRSAFPEALLDTNGFVATPIPVRRVGWDHGNLGVVGDLGQIDYFLEEPLQFGTVFTATLAWNRTVVIAANDFLNATTPGVAPTILQIELEDLALELWSADPFGNVQQLLFTSDSAGSNVEQLIVRMDLAPLAGINAVLRVVYRGQAFAFENANFANLEDLDLGDYEFRFLRPGDVEFGLAWATWSTIDTDLPANAQAAIPGAYNLPELLLLPASITQNATTQQLVENLGELLSAFGAGRGDVRYRGMLDLNNDGRIDSEDLAILLSAF